MSIIFTTTKRKTVHVELKILFSNTQVMKNFTTKPRHRKSSLGRCINFQSDTPSESQQSLNYAYCTYAICVVKVNLKTRKLYADCNKPMRDEYANTFTKYKECVI